MTQYDAGPGDWSDRPWEDPDRKPTPQARRRKVSLPPWALLAILVAIIIVLCVSLILIVRAIGGGGDNETPTPLPTSTVLVAPTEATAQIGPTEVITITPTATIVIPIGSPTAPPTFTEIGPGATVVVQGTGGAGLNLRQEASTTARVVVNVKDGTELTVLEGPEEASGYTWWKARTADGEEGWGAANWLVLKTE